MKLSKKQKAALFVPLFLLLTILIINPNPFGNSTDAVGDESIFLSSALSSIKKITLPGWEFSKSGSFYGGVQVYLDTIVLAPVVAIIRLCTGDNLLAQSTIALHTGKLLHLLRTINGIMALTVIVSAVYLHFKNKWPPNFGYKLLLLLALLMGNSLFVGIIHTAKVWSIFIILEIILGLIVVAQEHSLQLKQSSILKKDTYFAVLFWLTLLIICQNIAGITALLWIVYALFLKHFQFKNLLAYFKKKILYILLLLATQISFFYRSLSMYLDNKGPFSLTDLSGSAIRNPSGNFDWINRLWQPIKIAFESQPLTIIYLFFAVISLFYIIRRRNKQLPFYNKLLLIALVHPLLVYILRHVMFGMSTPPRHILPFSLALIFSIIIFLDWKTKIGKITIFAAAILFIAVSCKSILLYWRPASEKTINVMLSQNFNSPDNVFIIDGSAGRLNLPLNSDSLLLLDNDQKNMERYKFLLQHLDLVDSKVNFKPIVVTANTENEINYFVSLFNEQNKKIWRISMGCDNLCPEADLQEKKCFTINKRACLMKSSLPQESTNLPIFFHSKQLGYPYLIKMQ